MKLTDLTKKNQPNHIKWTEEYNKALVQLKTELCGDPILKLPDTSKAFTLRTDASDTGLGAVLLQLHQNILFPVAYISKKLLPQECNYSVMEKNVW